MSIPVTGVEAERKTSSGLIRNRRFMALFIGQCLASVGNSVYGLALLWEMGVLTGSPVKMSIVAMATVIPMIVLGPISGVLVDRWPKRLAMMVSDIFRAIVISTLTILLATHHLLPWMLVAGALLNSTAGTVYGPANNAFLPLLVKKDQLQSANALSQGGMVIAQLVGPFLGGILVAHVSMAAAFAVNAIGFLASVVSLIFVGHHDVQRLVRPFSVRQMAVELKEGLDAVRGIDAIWNLIPTALITNFLFAPFELLLIQYAKLVLHGGAQLYGEIGAMFSFGMLIGSILCGVLAKRVRKGILIACSFPLMSVMMIGLGVTHAIWITFLLCALMGVFLIIVNILFGTLIQEQVPQDKMGRVSGSLSTLMQAGQPFAQGMIGYMLSILSVPVLISCLGGLQTLNALDAARKKSVRGIV